MRNSSAILAQLNGTEVGVHNERTTPYFALRTTVRLLQELVDILARYRYNEFFLYRGEGSSLDDAEPNRSKLPLYCEMQGLSFAEIGSVEYDALLLDPTNVCVPTFAARSLAGRIEEMRRAMEAGEVTMRARRAKRFLVTDFSDGYAWQPLAVSLPAIILGGNFMTGGAKAANPKLDPAGLMLDALAIAAFREGDNKSAVNWFSASLTAPRRSHNNLHMMLNFGFALANVGRTREAKDMFVKLRNVSDRQVRERAAAAEATLRQASPPRFTWR